MTLPTIVPAKYSATVKDFTIAKADHSGAVRMEAFSASIASGTVVNTIVGLIPFRKGARFPINAMSITFDALGTGVTCNVGVVYNDNTNNTNNATLWVSGATTPAAGGTLAITKAYTAENYAATDDGWVVVTVTGATTGSTGTVHGQIETTYDPTN